MLRPPSEDSQLLPRPHKVGESYFEHLRFASRTGATMLIGGCACFVHGLLPWLCLTRGSDTIRALHHRMVTHRVVRSEKGHPAPGSETAVAAAD